MLKELDKNYNAISVEDKWYLYWSEKKYFKANVTQDKKPFTIVIPPPNVTAALHMGHAYNNTLQDILIRWKRMQGYMALYQPGTDHAGIATQTVVEKELAKDQITRNDLGREKFVERVWEWKEKYGSTIINQLKKLGISADWDRERFTMDEGLSKAVQKVFVDLYNKGLIYKGNRIVNWDPQSGTALADDEVDNKEIKGKLYHIRYHLKNSDDYIVVATTRPETLLGDTAVAINPQDTAKAHLLGKTVLIPFVNREVRIVADDYVEKDFGSGFVKITPAHDPNDFELGKRHQLEQILVLDKSAKIMLKCKRIDGSSETDELDIPERFVGLDRYEARKRIISELNEMGQIEAIEEYTHSVGHSYRSKVAIEPYLSEQWFVKMKPLSIKALSAVKNGEIKFYPEGRYEKTYEYWMENIKDWCISRQLWWGHRIPAWVNAKGEIKVCLEDPSDDLEKWTQDTDVLDTWFSSWLWPFSTMGWPDQTADLDYFYPSDVLVTGADIIFFWVARMIMAGYEFLGKKPFSHVYFNGIVRDEHGRKMSKTLGNGIDPLDVIAKFSTDAVRFTVVHLSSQGQDIKLAEKDFELGRNFSNKIWNSTRFLTMNLDKLYHDPSPYQHILDCEDRWIMSRLQIIINSVSNALEKFRFHEALHDIYAFFWNDFCDWYLEIIKRRFYQSNQVQDKEKAMAVASHVIKETMTLLHPFMPFVTEEIYQFFKSDSDPESIMIRNWPQADSNFIDTHAEQSIQLLQNIITSIRNIRAEMNIQTKIELKINILKDQKEQELIKLSDHIKFLCKAKEINFVDGFEAMPSVKLIVESIDIQIPLDGVIDFEAEKIRINKELDRKEALLKSSMVKLNNDNFVKSAPEAVVTAERNKITALRVDIDKLKASLESFN